MTDTNSTPNEADFGVVLEDGQSIRFVRDLPGPIENVWAYLTEARLLEKWLYGSEMPTEPGAEWGSSWEGEDGQPGGSIRFRMRVFDPPHVLEYDWAEVPSPSGTIRNSTVRFELEPAGERVRLTLTQSALPSGAFESVGAGWHAHLDVLRAVLTGVDGPDAETRYEALQERYAKLAP
jgi:uncharacterized protein YndB with AHSA1/START domain